MSELIATLSQPFQKARKVNQTSNGFVSKIPTATEPTGDAGTATGASILNCAGPGPMGQNGAAICFYGTGSDNNTFSCRVIGWRVLPRLLYSTTTTYLPNDLWVPVKLIEVQVTLSSTPIGVAGAPILAAELFADTIALTGTTGNDDVSVDIVSPADNTIAHMVLDLKGCQKLELSFTTGGVATDCNALVALI